MSYIIDKKDERLVCSVQLLQNKREKVRGSESEGEERVKDRDTLRVFACET